MNQKIIANGAHGCLVSPELLCKDDSDTRIPQSKRVSKIFREKKIWDDELVETSKIKEIPNYDKYFIVPLKACAVHESQIAIWKNCEKLIGKKPSNEKDLYQLVMRDGGLSLNDYIINRIEFREWIHIFLKILKCLKVLSVHKLVHMDIKLNNIVYDPVTKSVRLIDFGLTTSFDEIYISVYKSRYIYWPIEFVIYEHCNDKNTCDIESVNSEFTRNIKYEPFVNQKHTPLHSRDVLKSPKNLSKIDIYSLGIECMFIHWKIKGDIPKSYTQLISRMCALNCLERISIDDAIVCVKKSCLN
jgi:serine/threonine protein kinase